MASFAKGPIKFGSKDKDWTTISILGLSIGRLFFLATIVGTLAVIGVSAYLAKH